MTLIAASTQCASLVLVRALDVVIADVESFRSGNNAGFVETDKVRVDFGKYQLFSFVREGYERVTITKIVIY